MDAGFYLDRLPPTANPSVRKRLEQDRQISLLTLQNAALIAELETLKAAVGESRLKVEVTEQRRESVRSSERPAPFSAP
jgi:hypothetical protein